MERQNPFAAEMFWKRLAGWGLVLVGAAAVVITMGLSGEVVDGVDLIILMAEGLLTIAGLGLICSPDPARLPK